MDTPHCSSPFHVPSRHVRHGVVLALSLLVLCLVCASDAWGRAGGGGGGSSYSSGSSSGGGYSSSSGGAGSELPDACGYFMMAVLVVGLVGAVVEVFVRKAWGLRLRSQAIAQVQEGDPSFAPDPFLADFKLAFVAIQEAWMAQDMVAVRHFVSDGIDEKFAVQFREQQRLGYREQLDEITVHSATSLIQFESDGLFEVLTVRVVASIVDQRVSLKTGATIGGSSTAETFTEYWSLVRRRGTQTRQDGGSLLAGSCPNCDSPLTLNRLGSCQACDSLVRSGVYDWVLCEITQESEWQFDMPAELAARVRLYRQHFDPEFSRQHLEDRAWVIMARLGLADASRDLAPLRKVATPEFCEEYVIPCEEIRTDCSVKGLDLAGFVVEEEGQFALLRVAWRRNSVFQESLLVLFRQTGVKSNQEMALLSAHCPSCGAPEESQATDACASCGQVTNTGRYDWVLADFVDDQDSRQAHIWLREIMPDEVALALGVPTKSGPRLQPAACLVWAIGHLVRDGGLSVTERDVIGKCATRNRIAAGEVEAWVEQAQQGDVSSTTSARRSGCRGMVESVGGICAARRAHPWGRTQFVDAVG